MDIFFLFIGTATASLFTFFSGFGLGTLLLPFFALFFPVEIAIIYTAVIHLLNNLFKVFIFRNSIALKKVLLFGGPAIVGSACGALLLSKIAHWHIQYTGSILGIAIETNPIKIVVGLLLVFIGLNELVRLFEVNVKGRFAFTLGGFISGLFGGLAGLQGAFRSYFLVKSTEDKSAFLGTSAAVALMVDVIRVLIYSNLMTWTGGMSIYGFTVVLAALSGVFMGKQLLPKIQMESIHQLVAYLLIGFGSLFCIGII